VIQPVHFGTDGWRAVVADDFTYENVRAVSQAVAWYLEHDPRPVAVGHDSRYCAELFSQEVARVLAANGKHVLLVDTPAPTPVITWTVVKRRCAGGVVVTASHNPPEFNGLKYKPDYGGSAGVAVVEALEHLTERAQRDGVRAVPYAEAFAGGDVVIVDPLPDYLAQLATMVDLGRLRNAGLHVLHEAMFGSGAGYIKNILGGGTTVVDELHGERNPTFGGMHPEPIDRYMPEAIARMTEGGYDLAIANDGDADRLGVIDDTGRFVNQLEVAALLAMYFLEKRGLRGTIVRSLTTTNMLDKLGEQFGVDVIETPVGFKFIGPEMSRTGALFGCEESGGFAFRGHIPERDGILAGLFVADMIVEYGMPLSKILAHLFEVVGPHAYARHDHRLPRDGYAERKTTMYSEFTANPPTTLAGGTVVSSRTDDGFKYFLEDSSWALIRFSGTEPLIRVYSEASSPTRVEELLAAIEVHAGIGAGVVAATRPAH